LRGQEPRVWIMISFQRILFPIDFSPKSGAAAPFVKAMAARFHSEVSLFACRRSPYGWYGTLETGAFDALIDISSML
jgi:hypothetical protein